MRVGGPTDPNTASQYCTTFIRTLSHPAVVSLITQNGTTRTPAVLYSALAQQMWLYWH